MGYRLKTIELFFRSIPPPRMDFAIGKGQSLFPDWMRGNVEARLTLESDAGEFGVGYAADWPSFGWLDKRPEIEPKQKLRQLLELVQLARAVLLETADFETAFASWRSFHQRFLQQPAVQQAVPLCASFASALFERALIDAVCRVENRSFFDMLVNDGLGFRPQDIYPELSGLAASWPIAEPLGRIFIRHTVGLNDPLLRTQLTDENRIADGLPQALDEYVLQQGIRHLKIKVSQRIDDNLSRLETIWSMIAAADPVITLDGNEAFESVAQLHQFVAELKSSLPDMFERIQFVEQPLSRVATLDPSTSPGIREIAQMVPLLIDEADGYQRAFGDALKIGYQGVSHKNCKGVFKSLANARLCQLQSRPDRPLFQSAEDLTNMPIVAAHQDFAVLAALGLPHAERNAHHFFGGLSHLTAREQSSAVANYDKLYGATNDGIQMKIVNGSVDISQLQCPGLGVAQPPDWQSMAPLQEWIDELR